jgi:hypothetical protein
MGGGEGMEGRNGIQMSSAREKGILCVCVCVCDLGVEEYVYLS